MFKTQAMDVILKHLPRNIDCDALLGLLKNPISDVRLPAAAALGHLGINPKDAIEPLSSLLLEHPDYCRLRPTAAAALAKIETASNGAIDVDAVSADLQGDHAPVRARAAALLGTVQSPACVPTAIAALQTALQDAAVEVRRVAIEALERLGSPAITVLIEAMRADSEIRYDAVEALESIGEETIPHLIKAYAKCTPQAQAAIMEAVGRIHGCPDQAIPFLIAAMDNEDVDVSAGAIGALEEYGPEAAAAVPKLVHALRTQSKCDTYWERAILDTLRAIGQPAQSAIPHLMHYLEDGRDDIRRDAFVTIIDIGALAVEMEHLLDLLSEEHDRDFLYNVLADVQWSNISVDDVARMVAIYLAVLRSGPDRLDMSIFHMFQENVEWNRSLALLPLLTDALGEPHDLVVKYAALMIAEMGTAAGSAAEALTDALWIPDDEARVAIVSALGRIGRADLAAATLIDLLQSEDDDVRFEAALAAGRGNIDSEEILAVLREGMEEWDGRGQLGAAFAVQKLDPVTERAIPILMGGLRLHNGKTTELCWDAQHLLGEIGKPVVATLLEGLKDAGLYGHSIIDILDVGWATPGELAARALELLDSRNPELRILGAQLAPGIPIGSELSATVIRLWKGLLGGIQEVRWACAEALTAVVRAAENAADDLTT
jgi:HEAT repeat protein